MVEISAVETTYSSILKDSLEYDISLVKKETDIGVESEPVISKILPVITEVRSVNINNSKVVDESNSAVLTRNSDIVEETDDTEIKYSEIMFASNNIMEAELNEESVFPDLPGSSMHKRQQNGSRIPNKKRRLYSGMKGNQLCYFLSKEHIKFCQENKLIASSVLCFCGEPMVLKPYSDNMDGFLWCCPQTAFHKTDLSIRKGSWFENFELPIQDILWIAYMWLYNYSHFSMVHECNCSEKVLTCCLSKLQEACEAILKFKCDPIGGPNKLVEIFECKFKDTKKPKRVKNCNKNIKEQWIFCAIEQFSSKSIFIIVEDKESDTLCQIFDKYILNGSTVYGHIWNAYKHLSADSFNYLTEVKNITFHDSDTKSDIDTISKFWDVTKRPRPGFNRYNKYEYDLKFCESFYRKTLLFSTDAYLAFLKRFSYDLPATR